MELAGGARDRLRVLCDSSGRRKDENLDFCLPDLMSFPFPRAVNLVGIEETITGVVSWSVLDGALPRVVVGGLVVSLDRFRTISAFDSFSFRIAS